MKCNGVFCARVRDWFSGVREHVTKFVESITLLEIMLSITVVLLVFALFI